MRRLWFALGRLLRRCPTLNVPSAWRLIAPTHSRFLDMRNSPPIIAAAPSVAGGALFHYRPILSCDNFWQKRSVNVELKQIFPTVTADSSPCDAKATRAHN